MTKQRIYMDYNATSALKPQVKDVMYSIDLPSNPSSVHGYGRTAKAIIDNARDAVRKLVNAGTADVYFTSTGTEANNLAIRGIRAETYIVSSVEHPSVMNVAKNLNAEFIPVDQNGVVDLDALADTLSGLQKKALVSVMLANNETGVIQPIKEVSKIVFSYGGYLHCDASQALGKIPVDMQDLNVDMMTISAHKFGGPIGAAALVVKKGINLEPQIVGGGQEFGKRAGTENVYAIAGLAKACELATDDIAKFSEIRQIRDEIENSVKEYSGFDGLISSGVQRLPNTSSLYMAGVKAETQVINFDLEGIAVSAGSACSSGKVGESHVLRAMGIESSKLQNVIRISLTPDSTRDEVQKFIEVWKDLFDRANAKLIQAA